MREEASLATHAQGRCWRTATSAIRRLIGTSRLVVLIVSFVDFDPGRVKTE